MLDRSKLRSQSAASTEQHLQALGQEQFLRVTDGLRLGHQQIQVMRLTAGTGYTAVGTTRVQLLGVAEVVWRLCQPLSPSLVAFSKWVGGREDGHNETGYDLLVSFPNAEVREALLATIDPPPTTIEICCAFTAGLARAEQTARTVLAEVAEKCDAASRGHKTSAAVMTLVPREDFSYPADHPAYGGPNLKPEWLGPAAAQVFKELASDEPTLVPRGKGPDTYYDIVLSW